MILTTALFTSPVKQNSMPAGFIELTCVVINEREIKKYDVRYQQDHKKYKVEPKYLLCTYLCFR